LGLRDVVQVRLPLLARAGFAVGAILAGVLADVYGIPTAIAVVAVLTAASGCVVAVRMRESRPERATQL
jgi:predicted MFS family arabinose efflux permease